MTALEFIDIVQPYHGYMGLAVGKPGDVEHPTDREGVPFPTTWIVMDDAEMEKAVESCQRCHYLVVAGLQPAA